MLEEQGTKKKLMYCGQCWAGGSFGGSEVAWYSDTTVVSFYKSTGSGTPKVADNILVVPVLLLHCSRCPNLALVHKMTYTKAPLQLAREPQLLQHWLYSWFTSAGCRTMGTTVAAAGVRCIHGSCRGQSRLLICTHVTRVRHWKKLFLFQALHVADSAESTSLLWQEWLLYQM